MSPGGSWMPDPREQQKHRGVVEPAKHSGARSRMQVMWMWASLQGLMPIRPFWNSVHPSNAFHVPPACNSGSQFVASAVGGNLHS